MKTTTSPNIAIFVSQLAKSLNMDENVCFHKLQEALFNKYGKKWGINGKEILAFAPHKSQLVLYVNNDVVSFSSEDFHVYEYTDSDVYQRYTPWFVNGEFKFPIFEGQSENTIEPTKSYTILPAKIVIPAGEYTKKDLLGFIKML